MAGLSFNRAVHPAPLSTLAGLLAVILIVLAMVAAAEWWGDGEQRALLALPPESRERIYRRSLDDMAALCELPDVPDPFAERCRDKAVFLSRFPECREDCRALIDPYLPKPTR